MKALGLCILRGLSVKGGHGLCTVAAAKGMSVLQSSAVCRTLQSDTLNCVSRRGKIVQGSCRPFSKNIRVTVHQMKYKGDERVLREFERDDLEADTWKDLINYLHTEHRMHNAVIDGAIISLCNDKQNSHLAQSYVRFLREEENRPLNFSAMSQMMVLLSTGESNEKLILDMHKHLQNVCNPMPPLVALRVCMALCNTSLWQMAEGILPTIPPGPETSQAYLCCAQAAFTNGQLSKGWEYVDHLVQHNNHIKEESLFFALLNYLRMQTSDAKKEAEICKMFTLFKDEEIQLSPGLFSALRDTLPKDWALQTFDIGSRQDFLCPKCGSPLETVKQDKNSVVMLKKEYEQRALKGEDIFLNTTPGEWHAFLKFIRGRKFDIIVDHLNIMYFIVQGVYDYARDKRIYVTKLKELIQLLREQGMTRILLVGRQHQRKYLAKEKNNPFWNGVSFFYLINDSRDDGFFIYAALSSGLGTKICTRDYLRNHKFKLQELGLKQAFLTWQRLHQLVPDVDAKGNLTVNPLSLIVSSPQLHPTGWHLPILKELEDWEKDYFDTATLWACVQKKGSHGSSGQMPS